MIDNNYLILFEGFLWLARSSTRLTASLSAFVEQPDLFKMWPRLSLPVTVLLQVVAVLSQHPPSLNVPTDIVEKVSPLQVPYGRSVFINPMTNLKIKVKEEDRCFVTVIADPAEIMPGYITPEQFTCNFGPEEVKYSHLGSRSPSQHRIRLQIRYDTPTDTYVIPAALTVDVLFVQRTVVTQAQFITVPRLMGRSEPINGSVLEFTYDAANTCQITTNISPISLPQYGRLIDDPSFGSPVACEQFLAGKTTYQHTATTDSPNKDQIPMVVEIVTPDGDLLKQEYFQVEVRITGGLDNTAPILDFSAAMMMQVDQFVMTALTPEMLRAEDKESNPNDLVFNITRPLGPQQGGFCSTDDRNQVIKVTYWLNCL